MIRVGGLLEGRMTLLRISLVNLSGVGYLAFRPGSEPLTTVDWFIAIGAFVLGFVNLWSPFSVVIGLSVALGAGHFIGADNDVIPTVALAYALFELGMRHRGWRVWSGFALGLAGGVVSDYSALLVRPMSTIYGAGAGIAAAMLVGIQVRSVRDQARLAAGRARAEERAGIARELHDLVAHHVASIVLRVGVARNVLKVDDPQVRQVLDDVHGTASGALADLRRLVTVLRNPEPERQQSFVDPSGLPVALDAAVQRCRQIGLTVVAEIDPEVVRLDSRTALAVLRLTQEGLANVAKHAGTTAHARLRIQIAGEDVSFELMDSGGTEVGNANKGGVGLVGLRERVELLGGKFTAGPVPTGWRLSAQIQAVLT